MKQVFFSLMMTAMLFVSCGKEKEFDKNLKPAYEMLTKTFLDSDNVCVDISNAWSTAIFDKKTPSGKYCSDFNEAISEVIDGFC